MDASGEQSWARSKYPAHPSSNASVQSSRPNSPFAHSETSSAYPVPVSTRPIKALAPAPWYHAVTDDREQDSIMSRLENASLHSFLQSQSAMAMNNKSTDASSTAPSYSPPPSTSPPSVTYNHHPSLGASFEPSTNGLGVGDISRSSTPWSRSAYPRQAVSDTNGSVGHPSPRTRSIADYDEDEDQDDDYSPTTTPDRARTLRRIPWSQRIVSPVQLPEDDRSTTGSTSGPWKRRQSYPVHSTADETASQHPETPPPESESVPADGRGLHSTQLEESEVPKHSSPPSVAWSQKSYPLQQPSAGSTAGSVSPPRSDHGSSSRPEHDLKPDSESQPRQADLADQDTKESKQWNRRASYPLQIAANDTNLGSSPTPPQSSTEQDSKVNAKTLSASNPPLEQPHEVEQTATKPKKMRRHKGYPLQKTVSHNNVPPSPTPPASHTSESDAETETSSISTKTDEHLHENSQDNQDNQDVPASKMFRRQKYPLQVQANTPASKFQAPVESKPKSNLSKELKAGSAESLVEVSAEQPKESDQTSTKTPMFRRPSYPLVALASNTNTESTEASPPSYSALAKSESKKISKASEDQPEDLKNHAAENNDNTGKNDASKTTDTVGNNDTPPRQAYPLQEPIKVPAVQIVAPDDGKPSALEPREKEIAAKVVDHWRRGSYPLQSPQNISPFERPRTPQPPEDEKEEIKPHKKIHLPKHIRAGKDSESSPGRTIVMLLDGTGDKFDDDNSNIVHLVSALRKGDVANQVTYYQAGIGTYSDGGLSTGFAAAADMAVGSGLGLHVRDAYHFLMHSYKDGDKICIFGFSRGAYTARCLAGMIHKVGLLPPRNIQQIYFAYEFYANDTKLGWKQSEEFKKTFCIDVNVYFLGCFDSVASVGFIPRQLPLSSTPTSKPRYFRHAMALDERRAKFKICRHQKKNWEDIDKESDHKSESTVKKVFHAVTPSSYSRHKDQSDMPPPPPTPPTPPKQTIEPPPGYRKPRRFSTYYHPNVTDEEYHDLKAHDEIFETDVLEVWFAGAHADVGGGAVPNLERHKLAHIPLRWMIRQCFECDTGIIFKTKVLAEHGLDVHTLWPKYQRLKIPSHGPPPSITEKYEFDLPPREARRDKLVAVDAHHEGEPLYHFQGHKDNDWTPEQVEDFYDALCKINDQLIDAPTWWILELLPVEYKVPVAPGDIQFRTGPNLGRYRGVDDVEPNVHWTVLHRARQMGYKIQARTAPNTSWKTCV